MKTPAIHQALRLEKYPDEMAWLCFPDSEYPDGMTDLLRLCASKKRLKEYAEQYQLDAEYIQKALINFIEKAVLIEGNSSYKKLGLDVSSQKQLYKTHYKLLMKIYHPDVNSSSTASEYASMITKAYKKLKSEKIIKHKDESIINVSESRTPPRSFYTATQKTENQISNIKSAFAFVAALFIITLVAIVGHMHDPANPGIITQSNSETNYIAQKDSGLSSLNTQKSLDMFQESIINQTFIMAGINAKPTIQEIRNSALQSMLRNLETAYENGDVEHIKPILKNLPDIKDQTDLELSKKLMTLFEITSNRKMLLYSFDWNKTANQIEGKGNFLSRYRLVGEDEWITRDGIATIKANFKNGKIKVTQLIMENHTIE